MVGTGTDGSNTSRAPATSPREASTTSSTQCAVAQSTVVLNGSREIRGRRVEMAAGVGHLDAQADAAIGRAEHALGHLDLCVAREACPSHGHVRRRRKRGVRCDRHCRRGAERRAGVERDVGARRDRGVALVGDDDPARRGRAVDRRCVWPADERRTFTVRANARCRRCGRCGSRTGRRRRSGRTDSRRRIRSGANPTPLTVT